jgi:hypothetical protein
MIKIDLCVTHLNKFFTVVDSHLGHVDAVTAFGGDKAFAAFRESEQVSRAHKAAVVVHCCCNDSVCSISIVSMMRQCAASA